MQPILGLEPPVLTPYYSIIWWTMIIEALIVLVIGIIGINLQKYLKKRNERYENARSELKKTLLLLSETNTPFTHDCVEKKFLKLSYLLPTVSEISREKKDDSWFSLKTQIQDKYLLPMARKLAFSHLWVRQLRAARCFALATPKQEDERAILHLLQSKVPIIRYSIAYVAAELGTPKTFDALLKAMQSSTRYMRTLFLDALRKAGEKAFSYFENRLANENDPFNRVSCIELLSERMNFNIVKMIEPDLRSEYINLKIAAIKALGRYSDPRCAKLLIPQLEDPAWEVRALAARSLGYQKDSEAVPPLTGLLQDKVWWVRMNAASALRRMGEEGIEALKSVPEKDRFAYQTAQYVLAFETPNAGKVQMPKPSTAEPSVKTL